MPKIIDVSVALRPTTTVWPGSPAFRRDQVRTLDADDVNVSNIAMDVHTGTHVDAPLHHVSDGAAVDELSLAAMLGPAQVVDLTAVDQVDGEVLASVVDPGTVRVLMKTRNSARWSGTEPFTDDYVALSQDGARWIAESGIQLIGNDYLSIQRRGDDDEVHRVLLRSEVVILEGINLSDVPAGHYTLLCLPLRIPSAEGAPARAVLIGGSLDELP